MQSTGKAFNRRKIGVALDIVILFALLITISGVPACKQQNNPESLPSIPAGLDAKDEYLWEVTAKPYLEDPLWNSRDIYDAGHYLMVPLHAAFLLREKEWQQQFADHFNRFIAAYPEEVDEGRLNRLHYLYLASRYLVLTSQSGQTQLIPTQLPSLLYTEVKRLWQEEPAWQWARDAFPGGIRERVIWKLRTHDVERNYYRAIIDEELFLFAIAADLATYERLKAGGSSPLLSNILEVAYSVFQQEVVWQPNGGWLFQPGVLADHPDYAYAGNKEKIAGMEPLPVSGIAGSSSHFHRFPLWLTSLASAYDNREPQRPFYENLKHGLETQLFDNVLVPPSEDFFCYRMTNFMDGSNGIYRWEYPTQGPGNGYGPYELSGTLLLGWWAFLGTSRVQGVYQEMAKRFPLPEDVIAVYEGPGTSRERHHLIADSYYHGFKELIVRLAGRLCLWQAKGK